MVLKNIKNSGVTLIELMVVVAIFAIVSSVLLFNYSDFSTNVSIRNLSQDIALSIRKAQTYATSVQGIDTLGNTSRSYPGYGISFSLENTSSSFEPNNRDFVLFADIGDVLGTLPNKRYDGDGSCGEPHSQGECIENFSITTSDSIVEFCTDVTGCVSTGSLDITFHRPTADASICYKRTNDGLCQSETISYADIVIQSVKGLRRTVSVWNTGQISVK